MKKLLFVVALALFGAACTNGIEVSTYAACSAEITEKKAAFTLKCLANANPKADEEPEGWIHKCADMANDLYNPQCKTRRRYIVRDPNSRREYGPFECVNAQGAAKTACGL